MSGARFRAPPAVLGLLVAAVAKEVERVQRIRGIAGCLRELQGIIRLVGLRCLDDHILNVGFVGTHRVLPPDEALLSY